MARRKVAVKLTFGERMREWRKARKEYAEKVKAKLREEMDIKQNYPKQPAVPDKKVLTTSPTETTELKTGEVGPIPEPQNVLEQAVNVLRKAASEL